jgi:hypothetical protein
MTARAALVLGADGLPQQLQPGDSLAGVSSISGTATITLPDGQGVIEWAESIAAVGVTSASRVFLSFAATDDTDENDPEFLAAAVLQGTAGTDTIAVDISFAEPTSGPIKLNWGAF